MAKFECRVAVTPASAAVIRHFSAIGTVALDHMAERDGQFYLVLTSAEIKTLREHGLSVTRGAELKTRASHDDVGSIGGVDLETGFVTGYLDATRLLRGWPRWQALSPPGGR